MTHRQALRIACILIAASMVGAQACGRRHAPLGRRVIVLGFDGMDYALTRGLMARGRLPNLSRLAAMGTFQPLATSIPPQSPVAWSGFITGLDPGGHGIFDFIQRDPITMTPYLSTARTEPATHAVKLGKWQFPLSAGKVVSLRRGTPFWEVVERSGIETTVVRIPANYPPSGSATRELSGMGTPDILGTYGTFSFFTSDPLASRRTLSGGEVYPVTVSSGVVHGTLVGPDNPFLREPAPVTSAFTAYIDARREYVTLKVGDQERLLHTGAWSDWVPVEFDLIPSQHLAAECRFYLRQIDPYFELYVSPLNIDPLDPALPISSPAGFARDLARDTGRFYTQGMPEDTKSLKTGTLSTREFLAQAAIVGDENKRQYRDVLRRFDDGFLFYYFGNSDLVSHMMWRPMDPQHPAYDSATDPQYASVVADLYTGLDAIVGDTLNVLGSNDLLVVMSDHGFTSWRRAFNLNTWLRDNGYLSASGGPGQSAGFATVDWSRTRAYGLGLNGLYINVKGRERYGIVAPSDRGALVDEIASRLLSTMDPKTGAPAITKAFRREQAYHVDPALDAVAPDLIIGYAKGTRISDDSAIGGLSVEVFDDNRTAWTGDHCMDPDAVPGILVTSRKLRKPAPTLQSLGGAVLAELGIDFPAKEK